MKHVPISYGLDLLWLCFFDTDEMKNPTRREEENPPRE
jgi:hypothetical protein